MIKTLLTWSFDRPFKRLILISNKLLVNFRGMTEGSLWEILPKNPHPKSAILEKVPENLRTGGDRFWENLPEFACLI